MLDNDWLTKYITENYLDVTEQFDGEEHLNCFCSVCKKDVGFQITEREGVSHRTEYWSYSMDFEHPYSICFRCPSCKLYKIWIVFKRDLRYEVVNEEGVPVRYSEEHIFRVASLPNEGLVEISGLPDSPPSLKKAYKEAIRCMDANCFLGSAAMFRRALQIITREILGAKPGTLAQEIKSLMGVPNKLGVTLTNDFSDNWYIIKECGNQGAHPDDDPDLLDFTPEDAKNLHNIFLEIVSELFVAPAAAQKAKADLIAKRKL